MEYLPQVLTSIGMILTGWKLASSKVDEHTLRPGFNEFWKELKNSGFGFPLYDNTLYSIHRHDGLL